MAPKTTYHPTKVSERCYLCYTRPSRKHPFKRWDYCPLVHVCFSCNRDKKLALTKYVARRFKNKVTQCAPIKLSKEYKERVYTPYILAELDMNLLKLREERRVYIKTHPTPLLPLMGSLPADLDVHLTALSETYDHFLEVLATPLYNPPDLDLSFPGLPPPVAIEDTPMVSGVIGSDGTICRACVEPVIYAEHDPGCLFDYGGIEGKFNARFNKF